MINLEKYFSKENLIQKIKSVKSKGSISSKRIILIIEEILKGKYVFKPLKSYVIPKKYVILKKDSVEFYLKDKTFKEKQDFFKKTKDLRRGTKYCVEERQIFEEPIESKIVAMIIKEIIEDYYKNVWEDNLFSYRKGIGINNVIDYTKTKVSKSNLTFSAKFDIENFFPSIKKEFLINILKEKISLKNDKFYHLIKAYLKSGYQIKVKKKSQKIGAVSIRVIYKNKAKYFIYQGTVLAAIFSNLLSNQILLEINQLIRNKYWIGKKAKTNRYVHNLANKKYRGTISKEEYRKLINKSKPTVFSNDYIRAWVLIYSDDILLLGYMKESSRKDLIMEIEKIYNRYGLYFNDKKKVINTSPKNPITFLGLEIFESKKYKITAKQRQKSRIRIRPDKQRLIDKLIEKRLLMKRGELSPYNTRDTSKHQKNILAKKKQKKPKLRTTWSISEKYKPLHWGALVSQTADKIIKQYNFIMQGIYNYFKCTDEFHRLSQIFSFLRYSCYKTLVSKHKIGTIRKLFNKFGNNLEKLTKIRLIKPETKKIPLITILKKKEQETPIVYENIWNQTWLQDTKDILKSCYLCSSEENLESHHIKSIKKIREKLKVDKNKYKLYNWKYLQENPKTYFELLNVAINRKQITLCHQCHTDVHTNTISSDHAKKIAKLLKKDT